jgi:heptosyltransferase-2
MLKILIIRFSSIGDIVLTTPVVRCLKQQLPDAEIHYLTKPQFKAVVEHNPYISHVHCLTDSFSETIQNLRIEKFDYIIDLHHNLRTLRVKLALTGVKSASFNKLNFAKWLLVKTGLNRMPDVHIVDRYLDTVKQLGVTNDGKGLDYFMPADVAMQTKTQLPSAPFVAVVIGATHATKRLPAEKLIRICQNIQHPVILLGGKAEAEEGDLIASSAGLHVVNLCGKLSLHQSAYAVQQAQHVITHDTGMMHIAAAFQKPIVSVWGNTVPEFGMYPYYGAQQVPQLMAQVKGLSCRPCSKIGYHACPKGHFRCMTDQDEKLISHFRV